MILNFTERKILLLLFYPITEKMQCEVHFEMLLKNLLVLLVGGTIILLILATALGASLVFVVADLDNLKKRAEYTKLKSICTKMSLLPFLLQYSVNGVSYNHGALITYYTMYFF